MIEDNAVNPESRSQKHDYLGMDLNFTEKGEIGLSMIPYIDMRIKDFSEKIKSSSPFPHIGNLFKVMDEEESKFLSQEQAVIFHHSIAQLLFLALRTRKEL